MTEYQRYKKECRLSNVEPSRKDFNRDEIPNCVTYQLQLQKPEAVAAHARDGVVLW